MIDQAEVSSAHERVYIAGPMTGIRDFNYPAFHAAAAEWRAQGFHVENPAEVEPQPSWAHYMRVSLRRLLTCDTICLLPGWTRSRGAVIEWLVALALDMRVVYMGGEQPSLKILTLVLRLRNEVLK